jgi:PmbA protein
MSEQQLRAAAASAVAQALALGATGAECTLASGSEFSVTVRLGEVEKLKEADSCGAGLRVLLGQRQGSSYTSDLSAEGIRQMVASAMEIARITEPDPFAGLPEADELGQLPQDLGLASELTLSTAEKIDLAKRAEQAALAVDPRLTNSDGASFDSHTGVRVFANSRGFLGSYRSTYCSLSAVPVAKSDDRMERDYWYSIGRDHTRLESPEQIGRRWSLNRVRPARWSATFSRRSPAMPSTGKARFCSIRSGRPWPPPASPSSTTQRCLACSAPRRLMMKAFPAAGISSFKTVCLRPICCTPTRRASSASKPPATPRAA